MIGMTERYSNDDHQNCKFHDPRAKILVKGHGDIWFYSAKCLLYSWEEIKQTKYWKTRKGLRKLKISWHLRQWFSRYDVTIMVIQIWYVNFITPGAGILELACGQFVIWSLKLSNNSAKFMIQDAKVLMILDSQSVYSLCRSGLNWWIGT